MIKWCIPSYKRAGKVTTIDYLESIGVSKEDIYVFLQDENDYAEYQKLYSDRANIHYRKGSCVSDNRNNILDYFDDGEKILMLDDDLKYIGIKSGKRLVKMEKGSVVKFIEHAFDLIEKNHALIFTGYPASNALFMSNTIDKRMFGVGCMYGIINKGCYRFRPEYTIKEDIELCLRTMNDGYNCYRINFVTAVAKHKQDGGCKEFWVSDKDSECTKRLLIEYSGMIKKGCKENSVLMK